MEQELKDQLTERLKKLWIERTKSEFGEQVIFAKKKNDEIDRGLVVVYIDDILVLTKSFDYDQHLQDLSQVFKKLKNHNLKVKEEKCIFGVQTIEFLGNIVGNDNVVPLFSVSSPSSSGQNQ
ncbi:hypothetical protein ACTFIW_002268 [Dictyostelium discoideum]